MLIKPFNCTNTNFTMEIYISTVYGFCKLSSGLTEKIHMNGSVKIYVLRESYLLGKKLQFNLFAISVITLVLD